MRSRSYYINDDERLCLDSQFKKIGGVCAGLANYFSVDRLYIRIAALIALFLSPLSTIAAYALAYYVLDNETQV